MIEDKSVQNIVEREPGKHTVKKAKARGFLEEGAENHEILRKRMIIKKRPFSFYAWLSSYR